MSGFRQGGGKRRRDALEPQLRQALHACGVSTWQLHGTGLPDLLCHVRGGWVPLELKSEQGRLTAAQQHIEWPIVRSLDQAFAALGLDRRLAPLSAPLADERHRHQPRTRLDPMDTLERR